MKKKRLIAHLGLLLFSLLFLGVLTEGVLRVVWTLPMHSWNRSFIEYDPLFGWRKIPNARGMYVTDEYNVFESFNSQGIRGPEYAYEKKKNVYRVLVLGDSHAEGYTVDFETLFSEVMRAKLNESAGEVKVEVINGGTRGYSTDQELLFFEKEGKRYQPDLVILMFCHNDVWYNRASKMWRWYKPLFKVEKEELYLTNVPVPKPNQISSDRVKQFLNEHFYLYHFIHDKIRHSRFYSWFIQSGLVAFPDELRVWQKSGNTQIREAWGLTEALLAELKRKVTSSGSRLFIFYVPPRESYDAKNWAATKRKYGLSGEDWDAARPALELEMICRRHGIDFLNPTEQFKTEAKKLEPKSKQLHFFKDGHWTKEGHRLAGELLTEYISDRYDDVGAIVSPKKS